MNVLELSRLGEAGESDVVDVDGRFVVCERTREPFCGKRILYWAEYSLVYGEN